MPALTSRYAVNYFPVTNGGYQMWSRYDGGQYQADMESAKGFGFNTIRVILAAKSGYFTFDTPTPGELASLTDFYERSKSVIIALHLTLFDHWSCYGLIKESQTWTETVLEALPDISNIMVVEFQNETRYASTGIYNGDFDSGWPYDTQNTPKWVR